MVNVDRIAEPWGTRTPYAGGETWPTRVDMHLAEGLSEQDVDTWVQSASILHSNGDALDIAVKDGRIVGVRGRAQDRVNHGRLGPKDLFGWQANNSPDRLTKPLVRRDGAARRDRLGHRHGRGGRPDKGAAGRAGPSSIGFYTSGQLFLEEYYTLALIGHGGIGTNHMDGNTRLCTATAAAALKESFGCDGQPGSFTDIDHADVIALYGHNMAETQTVLWTRILDRLAGPNPPQLICVDPRPTPVARAATVHLAPRPGTNVTLMNALLHEIIENGWVDHDYVDGAHGRLRRARRTGCGLPARAGRPGLRRAGRATSGRRRGSSARRAAALHGAAGLLPVAPGHRGRRPGQQPPPAPRHARQARLRAAADERAADRGEHPRVRRRRRPPGLPQLGQRRPRRRARPGVERRPDADPALRRADAR